MKFWTVEVVPSIFIHLPRKRNHSGIRSIGQTIIRGTCKKSLQHLSCLVLCNIQIDHHISLTMFRSLTSRRTAQSLFKSWNGSPIPAIRNFSQSAPRRTDEDSKAPPKSKTTDFLHNLYGSRSMPNVKINENNTMSAFDESFMRKSAATSGINFDSFNRDPSTLPPPAEAEHEPYHFHVMATKHNTHITCTKPNREPIVSLSCGSLGYKKSRRSGFDSAYSLTKYVIERLIHNGWPLKIKRMEVVLRGYGQGRDAAVKVLMSPEGKVLRDKIVRVADSTRLKFGGTKSPRPRRL